MKLLVVVLLAAILVGCGDDQNDDITVWRDYFEHQLSPAEEAPDVQAGWTWIYPYTSASAWDIIGKDGSERTISSNGERVFGDYRKREIKIQYHGPCKCAMETISNSDGSEIGLAAIPLTSERFVLHNTYSDPIYVQYLGSPEKPGERIMISIGGNKSSQVNLPCNTLKNLSLPSGFKSLPFSIVDVPGLVGWQDNGSTIRSDYDEDGSIFYVDFKINPLKIMPVPPDPKQLSDPTTLVLVSPCFLGAFYCLHDVRTGQSGVFVAPPFVKERRVQWEGYHYPSDLRGKWLMLLPFNHPADSPIQAWFGNREVFVGPG